MPRRPEQDFLWGAASAAHQTEGGNVNTGLWRAEYAGVAKLGNGAVSGDACDSYHRWREDMDLLAQAGFTDYRFSVEWARIEPHPGHFSKAALGHYRRMIEGALTRGLRPMITLHHFTSPAWFDTTDGWSSADAPAAFARYVEAVASILDGVEHVCTINEPNMLALLRGMPSETGPELQARTPNPVVTASLTRAHHNAVSVLRKRRPLARIGWSPAIFNGYTDVPDEALVEQFTSSREDAFIRASADDDWIGVQAYTRTRLAGADGRLRVLAPPEGAELTLTGWEYYPAAVGDAVRRVASLISTPIIVTENGIATADDDRRIAYASEAIASMWQAVDDGIDVRGYFHWSLLDSYEWGSYDPTFGLVAVDRRTFERTAKPSLSWLGSLAPGISTTHSREQSHAGVLTS
jgi:beta-glucosidase